MQGSPTQSICGHCGATVAGAAIRCPTCGEDPILAGRYRLLAVVGQGAMGITYRGERVSDGEPVAVKELPYRRIDSMKTKALFAREARVLSQLDHPGVPAWHDDFTAGEGKNLSLFLVQGFVDGPTLAQEMETRRYSESEVLAIVAELLEILTYLHGLRPPVIHRDIKSGNVMRRRSDGRLVLVDFGAVRDAMKDQRVGGSTVVGTFGYMAPEQFQGIATPATDLYALGALAVELLSRRTPDTMIDYDGVLAWQGFVDVGPGTAGLLARMLERDPKARAADAARLRADVLEAIDALEGRAPTPRSTAPTPAAAPPPPASPPLARPTGQGDGLAPDPALRREARRGREPAEAVDRTATRVGVAVASLALIGVAAGAFITSRQPVAERPKVTGSRCGEVPCPPVARGLKGLEFGMSREEAEAALPELVGVAQEEGDTVQVHDGSLDFMLVGGGVRMPGFRLRVQTAIGTFGAECVLDFAVEQTLSKMTCTLAPFSTLSSHTAAEQTLLDTLRQRYGPERAADAPGRDTYAVGIEHAGRWTWSDAAAELELASTYKSFGAMGAGLLKDESVLVLTNTWARHGGIVRQKEAEERVRRDKLRALKRREVERKREEEMERLQQAGDSLQDDL